jgi:hypothetical protein
VSYAVDNGEPLFRLMKRSEASTWKNVIGPVESYSLFGYSNYGTISTLLNPRMAFTPFHSVIDFNSSSRLKAYCSIVHRHKRLARFYQLATKKFRTAKDVHTTSKVIDSTLTYLRDRLTMKDQTVTTTKNVLEAAAAAAKTMERAMPVAMAVQLEAQRAADSELGAHEHKQLLVELSKMRFEVSLTVKRSMLTNEAVINRFLTELGVHLHMNKRVAFGYDNTSNTTVERCASKYLRVSSWVASLGVYQEMFKKANFTAVRRNQPVTLRAMHQLRHLQNVLGVTSRTITSVISNKTFFSQAWKQPASREYEDYDAIWDQCWEERCRSEKEKKMKEAFFKHLWWRMMAKTAHFTVIYPSGGVFGHGSDNPSLVLQEAINYYESKTGIDIYNDEDPFKELNTIFKESKTGKSKWPKIKFVV